VNIVIVLLSLLGWKYLAFIEFTPERFVNLVEAISGQFSNQMTQTLLELIHPAPGGETNVFTNSFLNKLNTHS
jgi:hypothetical protein